MVTLGGLGQIERRLKAVEPEFGVVLFAALTVERWFVD